MTTLEIILSIVVYILLILVSLRPFKILEKNKVIDHPIGAAFFAPIFWILVLLISIIEGLKLLFENNESKGG